MYSAQGEKEHVNDFTTESLIKTNVPGSLRSTLWQPICCDKPIGLPELKVFRPEARFILCGSGGQQHVISGRQLLTHHNFLPVMDFPEAVGSPHLGVTGQELRVQDPHLVCCFRVWGRPRDVIVGLSLQQHSADYKVIHNYIFQKNSFLYCFA